MTTGTINFNAIDLAIRDGQLQEAQTQLEELMQLSPTKPGVIERLAVVLRQQQQWADVQELLLKARNRYGLWPEGSDLLMGQSLLEQGQLVQAKAYLEVASEEPGASWAHHFLGKVLRGLGEPDRAIAEQRLASDALPSFVWAPFEAAELLLDQAQPLEAILEAEEAKRRAGKDEARAIAQLEDRLKPAQALLAIERLVDQGNLEAAKSAMRAALIEHGENDALRRRASELLGINPISITFTGETSNLEEELDRFEALLDAFEAGLKK